MTTARRKNVELIETEGRILRLEYDPAAPPGAAAASVKIFGEISTVTLDAADLGRVRKALAKRAAKKAGAVLRAVLLFLVVGGAVGCGEALAPSCAPIPDGTYTAPAGDSYAFVGGQPSGNWSCIATDGCPGQIGCTPIGETVYTVGFVNEGDGTIEATTSPPDETVTLTREGGR